MMNARSQPEPFEPAYTALPPGELERRAEQALEMMSPCRACPRRCGVDRLADKPGLCLIGRHAVVASAFPHHGEEDPLRGWAGSGTIFFCGCNLKCVFCQNWDISQQVSGQQADAARLGRLMLSLQATGCHNVNWVTPEHVVPQVLEALPAAVAGGLRVPIVYNTSGYDAEECLGLLDGIVDIYMPDMKLWSPETCRDLLKAADYPDVARRGLLEMHRQVGDLQLDSQGIARRGLLIRHLVMPGLLDETKQILRWIAENLGPNTYINLMAQYRPAHKACDFEKISRPITSAEYRQAVKYARELGLNRLDKRPLGF